MFLYFTEWLSKFIQIPPASFLLSLQVKWNQATYTHEGWRELEKLDWNLLFSFLNRPTLPASKFVFGPVREGKKVNCNNRKMYSPWEIKCTNTLAFFYFSSSITFGFYFHPLYRMARTHFIHRNYWLTHKVHTSASKRGTLDPPK